jgi:hypothetical protein
MTIEAMPAVLRLALDEGTVCNKRIAYKAKTRAGAEGGYVATIADMQGATVARGWSAYSQRDAMRTALELLYNDGPAAVDAPPYVHAYKFHPRTAACDTGTCDVSA